MKSGGMTELAVDRPPEKRPLLLGHATTTVRRRGGSPQHLSAKKTGRPTNHLPHDAVEVAPHRNSSYTLKRV
jgi:hypothetical protein